MFRRPVLRWRFELGLISNQVGYVTADRTRVTRLATCGGYMVHRHLGEVRKHSGYKNYNKEWGRIRLLLEPVQVTT
jgi:hypothetical protein